MVKRDFTTRYTILTPLKYKDADSNIEALRQVIAYHGSFKPYSLIMQKSIYLINCVSSVTSTTFVK